MKLRRNHYIVLGVIVLIGIIVFQSLFSNGGKLSNLEALAALTQTKMEGRELTQLEIESGQFHNLRLRIDGLSCLSCSDTVFYGLVNMNGIVNAQIRQGSSCIVFDSEETSKKEILESELFTGGVYMAMGQSDEVIQKKEDARCL